MRDHSAASWWSSRGDIVLADFGLVGAFYVLREHYAHALGILPYLLLLACPFMHLFMHHGHGSRHRGDGRQDGGAVQDEPPPHAGR
ncbi:DUF2933 domain-containing protein [Roseomonas sp. KE2513]|uniref:DUF2933 domain-containing protein n=1 Tax=Roseomonas sp. KE2513 TaxID=2479202 RepID=UPI0018E0026E|nr:DUF2933 domain-containing protein [Roseomonas sp. KE2513]MBI0535205.1 DUF2933 domain-containing protein [Roseomonas sp. KE2513]